jgi:O-acetyl-ADP-ribose deacetylase (regulator of RNase III)
MVDVLKMIANTRLEIIQGDITLQDMDAIVNAANRKD